MRGVPDEPRGRLVGHPAHEALRVRRFQALSSSFREWVALLPIISRPWIVVLRVGRDTKAIESTVCN